MMDYEKFRKDVEGHTPGSWSVPHFATDLGCGCGYVFARGDEKTVCEVNYHDFRDRHDQYLPRDEATANARLIAAAPDLLRLLDESRALGREAVSALTSLRQASARVSVEPLGGVELLDALFMAEGEADGVLARARAVGWL